MVSFPEDNPTRGEQGNSKEKLHVNLSPILFTWNSRQNNYRISHQQPSLMDPWNLNVHLPCFLYSLITHWWTIHKISVTGNINNKNTNQIGGVYRRIHDIYRWISLLPFCQEENLLVKFCQGSVYQMTKKMLDKPL